jgi:hypothetical protein
MDVAVTNHTNPTVVVKSVQGNGRMADAGVVEPAPITVTCYRTGMRSTGYEAYVRRYGASARRVLFDELRKTVDMLTGRSEPLQLGRRDKDD